MEEMFFCPSCMAKTAPEDGRCPICGSDVNIQNAPHQLPVNTILNGRYLVGKVLGAGGFGITYIGYDLKLDSKVAVKEYYPSGAANRSVSMTVFPTTEVKDSPFEIGKDRFLKEAKTLSEFVGEGNIVTLRDYFEEHGTAYIVMEYLEGENLSHYTKEHGVFTIDEALDLLEPAMLALDKVHKKGLIHRDISPSNIMVMSDGRVKVLDFGSARLQNASGELSLSIMLKPGYAPAEQYSTHGEQGPWTDVYAMSATVYKLLTGKTPPPSTDRILDDTIELPSSLGVKITPEQEAALMRGLALRVPDRTQTMAELAKGLREGLPVPDKKPEKKGKTKKSAKPKKKKRPFAVAAVVLVVLALCAAAVPMLKDNFSKTEGTGNYASPEPTIDEAQQKLDELAAARKSIAGHRETTISAAKEHTAGLKTDGTVIAVGDNMHGQCDTSDWTGIAAVSAGSFHTVGLKPDGTVVAAGYNYFDQCDVSEWTDIAAVSAGGSHTVGIRSDGTVAAVGNNAYGQCDVSDWTDIVSVSASTEYTVGLKADGTVVAVGSNDDGKCEVSDWTDIVAVSTGEDHTVGLKTDGTVIAVGSNGDGRCEVSEWKDIIAVSAGNYHTVGLKADGTVVAVGYNRSGQCDVGDWTDIIAVSAGGYHTVGLRADGTVVAAGYIRNSACDVTDWTDIKLPESRSGAGADEEQQKLNELAAAREAAAGHGETTLRAGENCTIGLKTDGTVVAVGKYSSEYLNVSAWKNIIAVDASLYSAVGLQSDGSVLASGYLSCQHEISKWENISDVEFSGGHVVGLKPDGTVVAAGDNTRGQCNVSDWTDIVAVSADGSCTVGLRADGTVVAAGYNANGQCEVSGWTDIVAVSTSGFHTVGLKLDGTVVAVGQHGFGQCDVSDWTDIVAVSAGDMYTVGLKADGTVVTCGANKYGQCDVSDWTDIVAVSAGFNHSAGLKSDGTVIAAGDYSNGQRDVSGWTNIKLP